MTNNAASPDRTTRQTTRRCHAPNAVLMLLAVMALVAVSCTDKGRPPILPGTGEVSIGLRTDMSCDELVSETKAQLDTEITLAEQLTKFGAAGGFGADDMAVAEMAPMEDFEARSSGVAGGSQADASAGDGGLSDTPATAPASSLEGAQRDTDESADGEVVAGTNNQESGVDEADLVKTDGSRIVSLLDGMLRVVELDDAPGVDGTLDLRDFGGDRIGSEGAEMFLRGNELLVLMQSWGYSGPVPMPDVLDPLGGGVIEERSPEARPTLPEPQPDQPGEIGSGPLEDPQTMESPVPGTVDPSTTTTLPPEPVPTTVPDTTVPASTQPTTTVPPTTTSVTAPTTTTTQIDPIQPEPVQPEPMPFDIGVRILRIDLGELGSGTQPAVVEQRAVEGELVASRMIDGTARIVVRSSQPMNALMYRAESPDEARDMIEDIDSADVLPRATDDSGEVVSLGGCGDVAALPAVPVETIEAALDSGAVGIDGVGLATSDLGTGPSNVSVLTVGDTLGDLAPTTVAGLADIVYASTESVYVTSTGWTDAGPQTLIHRFALPADGAAAAYTGSGAVPGTPLNQYSLSELDGDLRIVTTIEDQDSGSTEGPTVDDDIIFEEDLTVDIAPMPFNTEGRLTVLRPDSDGTLAEIGSVEDLGIGETVQSVRFLGDMAYVVTFRQTDPLYAIDLSDPTEPTALGELKITGFSEYMHPVGDGLLLGIGREATQDGLDTGFKASLFDVSDPTNPTEVDKVVIPQAWSPVGQDPLAFTWDPVASNAIVPLERTPTLTCDASGVCEGAPQSGALVLSVDGTSLRELSFLDHAGGGNLSEAPILRSVVVDRDLWTLSRTGLARSDADNPTSLTLFPF
ncbi:MAG: beta-propeller domain-containing protein [Microthrixaceae bacterium]